MEYEDKEDSQAQVRLGEGGGFAITRTAEWVQLGKDIFLPNMAVWKEKLNVTDKYLVIPKGHIFHWSVFCFYPPVWKVISFLGV